MRCIVTSVQRIFCVFSTPREKLSNAFSFFTITYSSKMLCIAWCRAFLRCVAAFSLRVCAMRRRFSLHIYARGGVFVNIYKYEAFFEKYFSERAQNAWLCGFCMLCWYCKSNLQYFSCAAVSKKKGYARWVKVLLKWCDHMSDNGRIDCLFHQSLATQTLHVIIINHGRLMMLSGISFKNTIFRKEQNHETNIIIFSATDFINVFSFMQRCFPDWSRKRQYR